MHSSDVFGIFTDADLAKKELSQRKRMRTARMKDAMIDNIMITCPKCENVIATHEIWDFVRRVACISISVIFKNH
jgi:ribosomal protein L32